METQTSDLQTQPQTRFVFRILAGVIAAFILLIPLPYAVLESLDRGTLWTWFLVCCCLFGGVGMAVGARTGQWPFAWRGRQRND